MAIIRRTNQTNLNLDQTNKDNMNPISSGFTIHVFDYGNKFLYSFVQ